MADDVGGTWARGVTEHCTQDTGPPFNDVERGRLQCPPSVILLQEQTREVVTRADAEWRPVGSLTANRVLGGIPSGSAVGRRPASIRFPQPHRTHRP